MRSKTLIASVVLLAFVGSAYADVYRIEAEDAIFLSSWGIATNDNAYYGMYITATNDSGGDTPAYSPALFSFGAMPAGDYDLWLRLSVEVDYLDDSFWLPTTIDTTNDFRKINNVSYQIPVGDIIEEHAITATGLFGWVKLNGVGAVLTAEGGGDTNAYTLAEATDDLIFAIASREDGLGIDALALVTAGEEVGIPELDPFWVPPAFENESQSPIGWVSTPDVMIEAVIWERTNTVDSATMSIDGGVDVMPSISSVSNYATISYEATGLTEGTHTVEVIAHAADDDAITNNWSFGVLVDRTDKPIVLVHDWEFDQSSGLLVPDIVGGADGTIVGNGYAWTGEALDLLGGGTSGDYNSNNIPADAGSYVDLPNDLLDSYNDAVTFEVTYIVETSANWLRVWDLGDSDQVDEGDTGSGGSDIFLTSRAGITPPAIRVAVATAAPGSDNEFLQLADYEVPSINQLTHVVVTYDPVTLRSKIYVNGQLKNADIQMSQSYTLSTINDRNNFIGRSQYSNDGLFDGKIYDFRIYTGVMTSDEALANYKSLIGPSEPPVIDSVSASDGMVTILYSTDSGGSYSVEHATSLVSPSWTQVTNNLTKGDDQVIIVPMSGADQEFFRVKGE